MAKNLLHNADVHALLDQQARGCIPGIVDTGVADVGLSEDGLPGPPVVGPCDRPTAGGEYQVIAVHELPALSRFATVTICLAEVTTALRAAPVTTLPN
jgi:hypothetical protein